MCNASPAGIIYGFEPIPANFDFLSRKFPIARIFDMAISNYNGVADFYHVVDRPARSSLISHFERGAISEAKQTLPISIQVRRLDKIIPSGINIDLIKIDVEGAELDVLQGAFDVIKRSHPIIIFEHESQHNRANENVTFAIFKFLSTECAMRVQTLPGWLDNRPSLSENEFASKALKSGETHFLAY
jgi:FkbM family methyltransferase